MSTTIPSESNLQRIDQILAQARENGSVIGRSGRPVELGPTPIGEEDCRFLEGIVRKERPERTIETGFAFGFSGLTLIATMLDMGVDAPQHVALDPCQFGPFFDGAGAEVFQRSGLDDYLELLEEGSELALPRFVSEGRTFDLAFVDGSHWFEHAFLDIYYLAKLVKPGGLILVDDMWMPAVRQAVDYAVKNLGLVHENRRPARPYLLVGDRNIRSGRRSSQYRTAVLRVPEQAPKRVWDEFEDFSHKW